MSRALNGTGRVSEETRQRVVTAATSLGYRPSRLAQGFRSGSTTTIGIVIRSLSEPGTADVLSGIFDISEPAGYSILLAESLGDGSSPIRSLDFPIDGAIMLRGTHAEHRRGLRSRNIPLVDARNCGPGMPGDEYPTALEAYRTLVRLGHQHIGMIELASDVADERHRRRQDAADDAVRESPLHAAGETGLRPMQVPGPAAAYAAAAALIAEQVVTAISIGTDSLIPPVLQAVCDASMPVGAGISILGVAHGASTVETYPTLGLLAHDSRADGRQFARRLLVELGVRGLAGGTAGHEEAHWRFLQRASVTTSATIPNC